MIVILANCLNQLLGGIVGKIHARRDVIDFTAPYYYEPYTILIRKPQPKSKLWNALSVFSPNVWIGIFVSAIVAIFVAYFIHNLSPAPDSYWRRVSAVPPTNVTKLRTKAARIPVKSPLPVHAEECL